MTILQIKIRPELDRKNVLLSITEQTRRLTEFTANDYYRYLIEGTIINIASRNHPEFDMLTAKSAVFYLRGGSGFQYDITMLVPLSMVDILLTALRKVCNDAYDIKNNDILAEKDFLDTLYTFTD